ncbi:hypothetical protein CISIN_1g031851mg [Citrus sinensis]|uniref:nucleoside-diphosphate kinase n=1 Tax=Citrus sinensis TaxID=2711 RepID=A0A067HC88_CITSI|nr:hypothetical protein CISIN_1g031851mg [Citrus sinensis]
MEQTFIMIKPDGVQRGLVGEIIIRFEKKGFSLKGLKLMTVDRPFAEKHYEDLSSKPFFGSLIEYITSGPVVAMIWEGEGVVKTGRTIIGATNPAQSAPGTIRGDLAIVTGILSMEVTQLRVPRKKSPCGSLMALLTGRAAFTLGSMSKLMFG